MGSRCLRLSTIGAAAMAVAACGPAGESDVERHAATLNAYCLDCHNDIEQVGGLTLESLSLEQVDDARETWERVVRKLRAGMMPPADGPRPAPETYAGLTGFIEARLDRTAVPRMPAPGLHRLNRVEYANAVRDLLAVDIDPARFLPPDDSSNGFDNQAGTLGLSPALLEAYLAAAGRISRLAVGAAVAPTQATYRVAEDATQNYHVEGLPFGTRGGIRFEHLFPADGEYEIRVFSVNLGNMGNFRPFGEVRGEQLIVLVDGRPVEQFDWDAEFGNGFSGQLKTLDVRVPLTAGPHEIGVTFLATHYAPLLDLNDAFERSTIETGGLPGFTFYPHVGSVRVDGPYGAVAPDRTPSRDAIFVCRPGEDLSADVCAERIIRRLARLAYRGTGGERDIATLLEFYRDGAADGGFDGGIEMALQRLLTDPKFIYRYEAAPDDAVPGEVYALTDLELASRLSFFLWSSIPDAELLRLAERRQLSEPGILAEQVSRMLDDPRAAALSSNFAGQWLALRNLDGHQPVVDRFPDFDDNLRQAFRREVELLFSSLLAENRSVLELLTADYTFVDERLAKHYGIAGIRGSRFRRVELDDEHDARRGLLGKGSVLTVSSQPVRTSPVIRGYWVLQTLLGVTPPPPPPDVPELEPAPPDAAGNLAQPSLREQLELHRDNPACAGCHMLMDPIGFALEPFDATGQYRERDGVEPIDPTGVLYDGTPVTGPADLRAFLLRYETRFVRNVVEKLLTYALGRGIEYEDMPTVRAIAASAADRGYRFRDLILAVVESAPFRHNTAVDASAQDDGARQAAAAGP